MRTNRADLTIAAACCAAIGSYDALYVFLLLVGAPHFWPPVHALFPDFLVFHGAARAWLAGKAALVYDINAFTRFQNALYLDRFGGEADFRPFFYPPTWMLMLLPFGWLAAGKAYGAFMAITAAAATALVGWRDKWIWLAVATSPAAVWVVVAGQNTFLSVALFYGGMRLLDRSPALAGILLGLMTYKPQLWILVPVGLLAARQWRALLAMALTVAAAGLIGLGVLGIDCWRAFLTSSQAASGNVVADAMYEHFYTQMVTLFAMARGWGLPTNIANLIQLGGAALSGVAVWSVFRAFGPSPTRTAFLAAVTFLVSPYTMNYDLLLLMPAVVTLFRIGAAEGFYPGERILHVILWLMPTFGLALNRLDVPIMPLFVLLAAALAWARLQAAAKVELPEAAGAR
jgi:alpha-1,2-mannosyltransferase